jgi:ABC-2 type transport system permease protein
MRNFKDSITNENYEGVLLIPKTANVADLENKIKFISNSSPSIVFIEKIQNIVANKITKTNLEKNLDTLAIKMPSRQYKFSKSFRREKCKRP